MEKHRQDYGKKPGGYNTRPQGEHVQPREGEHGRGFHRENSKDNSREGVKENIHEGQRENFWNSQREGAREHTRDSSRENQREGMPRQNYQHQNHSPRYNKFKAVETVEDIKADILRLEKEIELELKEIRSLRLGL